MQKTQISPVLDELIGGTSYANFLVDMIYLFPSWIILPQTPVNVAELAVEQGFYSRKDTNG